MNRFISEKNGKGARLCFLVSFDGIVDLCTIMPFFFLSGFIALRMLRVVRIFHLFRINAYYDSFHVITSVLAEKKNQIISSVFIILILMMAIVISFLRVGAVAIPTGIISAGFVEQYTQLQNQAKSRTGGKARGTAGMTVDKASPFAGIAVKKAEEQY